MQKYSVLMSLYYKEDPDTVRTAVDSMLNQTVPTDDFVIVCDGPLTPALDTLLAELVSENPGIFQILRLPENRGIGYAANIGLQACKYDLVAKMDADDISMPERCALQLAQFDRDPQLAICGGYIEEFDDDPMKPFAVRAVPLAHEAIYEYGRRRQAFNNMTVMYRREVVLAIGGYSDLRRNEDYDMYARLMAGGYRGSNLSDILVKARVDREAHQRRGSMVTLKGCIHSRWRAYRIGYTRFGDFLYCVVGQLMLVLYPAKLQQWIYVTFLRKSVKTC